MKIIHLITGLSIGGTEIFLTKTLPHLKQYENVVVSLTTKNKLGLELEKNNIKVYELFSGKWFSPSAIFKFRKIVKEENPEIIVTYLIHAAIFGRLFGKLFGVKRVVCMIRSQLRERKHAIYFLLEKATQKLVDHFISNSHSLKNFYKNKLRIPEEKIKVIYSPVFVENNQETISFLKEGKFIIGAVGRLAPEKRQEDVIKAASKLKNNFKIIIVGNGPEKQNLQKLVRKTNLQEKVFFAGEQKNVCPWIKLFDVFILASEYEGMSNALLEAMSLGIPVIATNIPENKEIIEDNETGLLFPVRKPEILAEKINLIINNNELKNKLSANAKQFIINNFSLNKFIEKFDSITR